LSVLSVSKPTVPPLALVLLLLTGSLLVQFDENDFSGWLRIIVIWATAFGWCALLGVLFYQIVRWRKLYWPKAKRYFIPIHGVCCCTLIVVGFRDTRNALDSNRWIEVSTEYASLPFEIEPGDTYYAFDLSQEATTGLQNISNTGNENFLWPKDIGIQDKTKFSWFGYLCTIRNRGPHSFYEINFDTKVECVQKYYGEQIPKTESTIRHVRIEHLGPGESVRILLGTVRKDVYIEIYKPKEISVRIENHPETQRVQTLLLPFRESFISKLEFWQVDGPIEFVGH
jgi:hypothetical protein